MRHTNWLRHSRRWPVAALAATALAAVPILPAQAGAASGHVRTERGGEDLGAPVLAVDGQKVPNRYLVVLKGEPGARTSLAAAERAVGLGARITHRYSHALAGFAATLSPVQLAAIRHDPAVKHIVPDSTVTVGAVQNPSPWGLDRVDQRALPLDNSYIYGRTGSGVTAYVIDSGIRATHTEFEGRVLPGHTVIHDGLGTADCLNHGTHVAGTIAGRTYGIAKAAQVVPVRVFGCDRNKGNASDVIAGVDWVTANRRTPAVVNMSLGGGANPAVDAAVARSVAGGLTYVVAAGNDGERGGVDACGISPARTTAAITVGASTRTDSRDTRYSNYGACLDLFAPGTAIRSAANSGDTATAESDGTSMAAPHVSGVAALLLQDRPGAAPRTIHDLIVSAATTGILSAIGPGSPNRLLHHAPPPAPTPTPPPPSPAPGVPPAGGGVSGDFTGDGLDDTMVLYDYGAATSGLWVFPGVARGGTSAPFLAWQSGTGSFDATRSKVTAGDADGDGRTDVLVFYDYGGGTSGLWVFPGVTHGATTAPYRSWQSGTGSFDATRSRVSAGDADGDGRADLLVFYDYGGGTSGLWVFPGVPRAATTAPYRSWQSGTGSFDATRSKVTAADADGDGHADLLVLYDYGGGTSGLWAFPGVARGGTSAPYRSWQSGTGSFDAGRSAVA